jgi:RHS repeat-associated protein
MNLPCAGGNSGGLFYAYFPDGTTGPLTDINGTVQDVYLDSAYGEQWGYMGWGDPNPFQYGGQFGYYADPLNIVSLVLCGQRWYVPNGGFWLSRDPAGYAGSDNLYRYCADKPTDNVDPLGLDVWVVTWKGGCGFGSHAGIAVSCPGQKLPLEFDFGPGSDFTESKAANMLLYGLGCSTKGEVMFPMPFDVRHPRVPSHAGKPGRKKGTWTERPDPPTSAVRIRTKDWQDDLIRQWLWSTVTDDEDGNDIYNGMFGDYNGAYHHCANYVLEALYQGDVMPWWQALMTDPRPGDLRNWAIAVGGKEEMKAW